MKRGSLGKGTGVRTYMPHKGQILQICQRKENRSYSPYTARHAIACPSYECCDEGFAQGRLGVEGCDGCAGEDDAEGVGRHEDE